MRLCTARAILSAAGGGVAGAYQEPARSSSIRPCRPRVKIKLRASDSCERGHRRSGWALGFNVKLMAGISVPVPSVDDGAIADRLGPPSESGRDSVEYLPVCYRYFDCFDSFSGWYGMVVFTSGIDSLIFVRHLIV
mgnify:CR=1 FL=1